MRLNKNDLMKCKDCGTKTLVKDLKPVLEQKDEAGVLANLVCPVCDCPELMRVQKGEVIK
jgi:hypothetical protein